MSLDRVKCGQVTDKGMCIAIIPSYSEENNNIHLFVENWFEEINEAEADLFYTVSDYDLYEYEDGGVEIRVYGDVERK